MSVNNRKGPIVDPGMCRCCGALKKCRLLNVEYEWSGQREVYADMFVDCFGLVLSHLEGEESERVICATCVVRLRDACAFRQQVLLCEEKLLTAMVHIHDTIENIKMEVEVKEEVISTPLQAANDSDNDVDDHVTDPIDDSMQHIDEETTNELSNEVKYLGDNLDSVELRKPARHTHIKETSTTTMSIQVKLEELQDSSVELSLPQRREGATVDPAQVDMLDKLNSMKQKLDQMQHIDDTRAESPLYRRPDTTDKDLHIIRNAVKIVENSYVCPFTTVFSDYHCIYCREMFLDPNELREHTMTHDPKMYKDVVERNTRKLIQVDIERIDCRLCEEKIDTVESFKDHFTTVHGQKLYKDVHNEFMPFKLKIGTLTCVECGKHVSFFHALKKHMAEHFGTFICDVCGVHYFEERHLIIHKKSHNKKKDPIFPCNECDKTFRSKNSRSFHIARIHKNEPAYPCNKCDEIFISYHMRYKHKMSVHGEKRMFPCEGCDRVFESRKTLREHNQRTHLQLFRHECTLCDKKFYLPSALRDHMTSHTGERNFRCEFCGKNYPRSKALKVHLQSHSAEKRYKCSLCPSAYTQVTNYKNHMKTKHPAPDLVVEGYR